MYAIIDIETTGGSYRNEKITEIAVFIHDGEKVVSEFTTLINPEKFIPPYITAMTGITNDMVANAPKFFEIAKQLVEITENTIFVAHNVGFDYNFIKAEFQSLGYEYKREQLCTVRLSRKLIPGLKSYSLGNICNDLSIIINGRHRAAGDALATVQLFEKLLYLDTQCQKSTIQVKRNRLKNVNPDLNLDIIHALPEKAGVYYFHNECGKIIYIGKSRNIRERVMTHLSNETTKRSIEMRDKITDITHQATGSELIALLLESEEIKKHKPLYNRMQRRSSFNYGLFTYTDSLGYVRFLLDKNAHRVEIPLTSFLNKAEALEKLNLFITQYNLCQKLCGIYNTKSGCFHHEIGLCAGACKGIEPIDTYNSRANLLVNSLQYQNKNVLIIDRGRSLDEKTVVKIQNGKYMGFGFVQEDIAINDASEIDDYLNSYSDNRDVFSIINNYLRNHHVERIIKY